jgi:hypothetical protein
MDAKPTALERAFQLAKSGICASIPDLRRRLKAEGYSANQVTGPTLNKQLVALIQSARQQENP